MPEAPNCDELLGIAVSAGQDAAALLLRRLEHTRGDIGTKTSGTDMVTEVDRESEQLITERLRAARPHDGILGEEEGEHAGTSGLRWVVDPLDGTTNYLYGYPGFAVSIAVQDDRGAVAAVVVDPLHQDMFTAVRGAGAERNGRSIRCSPKADLATALVATGFSYLPARRRRQAGVLTHVLPEIRDIRRGGAAAVDLCWVACGRVDGFYEKGLQAWDFAAGALIALEAGALVGDLSGGPGSEDFMLAAAPPLFGPLRDLLSRADADSA